MRLAKKFRFIFYSVLFTICSILYSIKLLRVIYSYTGTLFVESASNVFKIDLKFDLLIFFVFSSMFLCAQYRNFTQFTQSSANQVN